MSASSRTPQSAADSSSGIEEDLLGFLESKTMISWNQDLDLFASGGLSSLFAMELVVHLEKKFDVSIRGADLKLENFRTVRTMAALVRRLQVPESGGGDE